MDSCEISAVRKFRLSDLETVRDLIHGTIDLSYSDFYPSGAIRFFKKFHSEAAILQRYRDGDILVADKEGIIIGTGSLMGIEILGVFVHPEFQGLGCGRLIMDALEQIAVSRGVREIELSVSLPSRKFYETLGYHILDPCTLDVGDGEHLDYWQAKKSLTQRSASEIPGSRH